MMSGIAEEYANKYLGLEKPLTPEQDEYRRNLRDVVINGKAWCLICIGSKGNGKSHYGQIAVNTYNRAVERGALYVTQPQIQNELWSDREKNGDIYRRYVNAPVLVIDELSDRKSDWTEFVKTSIENILIERHRNYRRTVLIGNLDKTRFGLMFDTRVRDRFKEGIFMTMTGESLRKKNNE